VESKRNIQVMTVMKWCWPPLEAPNTTVKRRGIDLISVPRKTGLIMATAIQVAIPEESSKGSVTTAARSGTRNLIVGSLKKIRTSPRRTISEETPNTATLQSAVAPEMMTRMPSF
jgi:hypothetical protein